MGNVIPFPGHAKDGVPPDLAALITQLSGVGGHHFDPFGGVGSYGRPRPKLLRRRSKKVTYVVRVDLDGAKPPIWRRLRLASDLSLLDLHDVLQVAMGWTDSHLHHFQMGPDTKDFRIEAFLTDFDLSEGLTDGIHEGDVRLDQVLASPGQRLFYEYDFGDSWSHTIKLEKVEPWVEDAPAAVCVTGRRACPPEDVGGIPGYEDACAALRGEVVGSPEWTRELLDWLPEDHDPEHFDADEVNQALQFDGWDLAGWHPALGELLARVHPAFSTIPVLVDEVTDERVELTDHELAAATHRYRHLLEVIGQGVQLTKAGHLPPAVVEELFFGLHLDNEWISKDNRENQAVPVQTLRQSATSLGLLRKQKERLLLTASGRRLVDDPRGLFEHIRDRLPLGRDRAKQDAGLLALLHTAAGEEFFDRREVAGEEFASLGWSSPDPLDQVVWHVAHPTWEVLEHLTGRRGGIGPRSRIARALLTR